MQTAPPDKLLNPPRCGGKSKEQSGFRSAERCLRSLSRQIPAIQMRSPGEDMVFIGKPDRLLADHFGFLQKETKVTKPNFRLTSCPSFSSLSSVQNFEFKQRFLSAVIPSVASCKIRCRFGCGVAALSDA
jgi:hypothetical protein